MFSGYYPNPAVDAFPDHLVGWYWEGYSCFSSDFSTVVAPTHECTFENLLFTISGRQHQIRNNRIQMNIDKTTLTV